MIDPLFYAIHRQPRTHQKNDIQTSNPFTREVQEKEIFKGVSNPSNLPSNIQVLNVAYYPQERGPYNYDTSLDPFGKLLNPQRRWGGDYERSTHQ
ncbi:MAG: hypothetical protein HC905_13055 [Bacteroidales bacterium]|nr:hypothetical protein [Bacteroidales bacterium]